MGTLALNAAGSPTNSSGTTTITPGMPAFSAGQLLILTVGCATAAESITTPSGYTEFGARSTHHKIFGRIAVGGDTAPTITLSGTGLHSAAMVSLSGDVWSDIATMVDATNSNFQSSSSTANLPALNQATHGFDQDNCYILAYGTRNKSTTSNGATWNTAAGYTKLVEAYPNGSQDAFTLQGLQQTTRADISAFTIGVTGGGAESVATTGIIVALRTSTPVTTGWQQFYSQQPRSTLLRM